VGVSSESRQATIRTLNRETSRGMDSINRIVGYTLKIACFEKRDRPQHFLRSVVFDVPLMSINEIGQISVGTILKGHLEFCPNVRQALKPTVVWTVTTTIKKLRI
jgi:hypothetical protein